MLVLFLIWKVLFSTVLTECNVRGNSLDSESAHTLAKVATEKGVMLFGIKHDQKEANFSDQRLGPVDAILIASDLRVTAVMTACTLIKNNLDIESAAMLAKIATEKRIMLSGMKQDRTEASYYNQGLKPADAILIASDLPFMAVLTSLDVGLNSLDEEAALGIVRAARQHDRMTFLGLARCGIGPTGAKEIAEYISVTAVLTECSLLKNNLDVESATMLAKIGTEKRIMLSGMKHKNTDTADTTVPTISMV